MNNVTTSKIKLLFRPTYRPDRKGFVKIRCFTEIKGNKMEFSTPITIKVTDWKNGKPTAKYVKDQLAHFTTAFQEIICKLEKQGLPLTHQNISNQIFLLDKKTKEKTITKGLHLPTRISLLTALEKIMQVRKNELAPTTINRDLSYFKYFKQYFKDRLHLSPTSISKVDVLDYLDYIKQKGVKNRTRNHYLTWIKAVFNQMVERGFIDENPAKDIKKLKVEESQIFAFEPEHIKPLFQLCKEKDEELYIFCLFVFYTFIRPIELRRLKVSQVNLSQNKIIIYGNQSKNKKTEFVMIPLALAKVLQETKFLERPPNDYLFSDYHELQYSRNKFSVMFSEIVRQNGFPKNYSLYCFKHTGVVEAYKAGLGIKFIKEQCRHSSLEITDKYLRSLGLYDNAEIIGKFADYTI
ncbi:MAG: tyrosine-type recombinase/integrase [Raineya sp.]|nr:tyrosine-type recombinase/integrase [Raineya sp.]